LGRAGHLGRFWEIENSLGHFARRKKKTIFSQIIGKNAKKVDFTESFCIKFLRKTGAN